MAVAHSRAVLIAGASGLVGGHLLRQLIDDVTVSEVHVLARRALPVAHAKLRTHVVSFDALPVLPKVDEVYLALGTTIGVAGSKEAFRAVDLFANLAVAKAATERGATRIGTGQCGGRGCSLFRLLQQDKRRAGVSAENIEPDYPCDRSALLVIGRSRCPQAAVSTRRKTGHSHCKIACAGFAGRIQTCQGSRCCQRIDIPAACKKRRD